MGCVFLSFAVTVGSFVTVLGLEQVLQAFIAGLFAQFPFRRVESCYHRYPQSSFLILSCARRTTAIKNGVRMLLRPEFSTLFFNNCCRRHTCFEALVVAVVSLNISGCFLDSGPCYAVTLGSGGLGSKALRKWEKIEHPQYISVSLDD